MSSFVKGGGGSEKVTIDGVKVKEKMNLTSYSGDNPYTMGADGLTLAANTLLKDGLQIINGVSGEDLTDTAAEQTSAVNALLTMVKRKVAENNGEGQFVWKKLTAEGGDFVDYVISSDSEAYPDGGELDGYWYEMVEEGMNLLSICGFTEIAIDTFTPSNNIKLGNRNTLSHSLNKNPKFFIILCDIESAPTGISDAVACGMSIVGATTSGPYIAFNELKDRNGNHGAYYEYLDPNEPVTANSIKFWATDTNYYFKAGVTYTLITMA